MNQGTCSLQSVKKVVFFLIILTAFPSGFLFAEEGSNDTFNDVPLSEGLVSYWPLDEDVGIKEDAHGGNDLITETTVSRGDGVLGYGVDFENSNNEALVIADVTQNDLNISDSMTISMWINPESFRYGDGQALLTKWEHAKNNQYHFDVSGDYLNIHIANSCEGFNYEKKSWSHSMILGNWYHIVIVYKASTGEAEAFVNKVSLGTVEGLPNSIPNCNADFKLGDREDTVSSEYHFDGLMDEVGIWNRVLTVDEVAKLYNDGKGLPYEAFVELPVEPPVEGASSVAFFPGIMGSRLYSNEGGGVTRLWESIWSWNIKKLSLTKTGESEDSTIYTRDIIETLRPFTGWWDYSEGYKDFIVYMNNLVATDVIKHWSPIPYDWRLATNKFGTLGSLSDFYKISYLTGEQTYPYMSMMLDDLASKSTTGKVTIVAHSNGGLVVKNLIKFYEKNDPSMLKKIDTVVLVAVPQFGTPKAIGELLHGTIPTTQGVTRDAMENMPGVYGLLPSRAFYSVYDKPLVDFDKKLETFDDYKEVADTSLASYEDVKRYLLGEIVPREEPDTYKIREPNVLNATVLEDMEAMHEDVDTWKFPEGIRVIELVGTGLVTPSGVRYGDSCTLEGACNWKFIANEWKNDSAGDGTVLTVSADGGEADETYYVALDKLNADKKKDYKHATILSAPNVLEFIQHNVIGDSDELPGLMGTDLKKTASYPRFEMRVYSPIDMHLYADGMHTGVVQGALETEMGREYETRVPNSYYREWGDVAYIGSDFSQGPVEVRLQGTGEGVFTLVIDMYEGETKTDTYTFKIVTVHPGSFGTFVLSENGVPSIAYDVDGDGVFEQVLTVEGTQPTVEEYLAELKLKIISTALPRATKEWLNMRVALVEKLLEKKGKGNIRAIEAVLNTILQTFERKVTTKYLTEKEVAELTKLVENILTLMRK